MTDTPLSDAVVERVAEAIGDFLDERFPDGAMPGGQQLFATDHLDAEFKHEAGCDALARAALGAARYGEMVEMLKTVRLAVASADADAFGEGISGYTRHGEPETYPLRDELLTAIDRALLSSIGASQP